MKEVVVSAERIGNEVVVVVVPNHVCVLKNIQPRVVERGAAVAAKGDDEEYFVDAALVAREMWEKRRSMTTTTTTTTTMRERRLIELKAFTQKKNFNSRTL